MLACTAGLVAATVLEVTTGASSGFLGNLPFLHPGRGRLTSMPAPSAAGEPGRSSGCWSPSTPTGPLRIEVVPVLGTSRVFEGGRLCGPGQAQRHGDQGRGADSSNDSSHANPPKTVGR